MLTPFHSPTINEHFISKGFALFPFLNEIMLNQVHQVYIAFDEKNKLSEQRHFYGVNYSLNILSKTENQHLVETITDIILPALEEHFCDYRILGVTFITKPPITNETFVYHQDWSYTNEKEHAFATCWVPLYDTNTNNGCMSVIEGTHRSFETYRSDTLDSARIPFDEIPGEIRTDVEMKAGQCLVFHQALFHGSYPNITNRSRPVLAFVVKNKLSPVIYYINSGKGVKGYHVSDDDFNRMLTEIPHSSLPNSAEKVLETQKRPPLPQAHEVVAAWRNYKPEHRLLKNSALQKNFIEQGYLHLKKELPVELIDELKKYYTQHFKAGRGMYVSHHFERDASVNQQHSRFIFSLIQPFLEACFENIRPLIAHYASKLPGPEGLFKLHQDWSIVPEELFGVAHCWIPLQPVSSKNGTLAVLPGSHLIFHNYRSGTCPIRFLPFEPFKEVMLEFEAEPGDIILYHPALFHGSGRNHSNEERIAVVAAVAHNDAPLVYYHRQEGEVHQFTLTEKDLFSRLDDLAKGMLPEGANNGMVTKRCLEQQEEQLVQELLLKISPTVYHAEI